MNDIVKKQLSQVKIADLSHFNEKDNTYFIPQKKTIKLEQNKAYLVYLNDSFYYNDVVSSNWNKGSQPKDRYLKLEVENVMGNMIKVVSIGYDALNKIDTNNFWNGWICISDIQVLQKL